MKRRDFIKNVAISSGALLIPSALFSYVMEQKFHIVIIGNSILEYIEDFCEQNSFTSFTSIGWEEEQLLDFSLSNEKNIEFDFSSITVNLAQPLYNSGMIPLQIKEVFRPQRSYLILCGLFRAEALLSAAIIDWLDMECVDYGFFGSIPVLNPGLPSWTAKVFSKFDNNPKVLIYDTNLYLNKLRHENGGILFRDAVTKCNDRRVEELSLFYNSLKV